MHRQPQHQLLSTTTIPEAIKGLASRASAGRSASPRPVETTKTEVVSEEERVIGEVAMNGSIGGLKVVKLADRINAFVWSDTEMRVSHRPCNSTHTDLSCFKIFEVRADEVSLVASCDICGTRDIQSITDGSFHLFTEVSALATYQLRY